MSLGFLVSNMRDGGTGHSIVRRKRYTHKATCDKPMNDTKSFTDSFKIPAEEVCQLTDSAPAHGRQRQVDL